MKGISKVRYLLLLMVIVIAPVLSIVSCKSWKQPDSEQHDVDLMIWVERVLPGSMASSMWSGVTSHTDLTRKSHAF
jgi:hypothetical protein